MILTGENRITRTVFPIANCYTTNLIWNDLGSNLGLRGRRAAINLPIHGLRLTRIILKRLSSYRAVNKLSRF